MPRQDAIRVTPDSCGCSFYVRSDGSFISYEDVRKEHQARIAARDPSANPVISPPDVLCPDHTALGYRMDQSLIDVIREEQGRREKVLQDMAKEAGVDLFPDREAIRNEIMSDATLSARDKTVKVFTVIQAMEAEALTFRAQYQWGFDSQRNLKASHPRLSTAQKASVSVKAEAEHGRGKVEVI